MHLAQDNITQMTDSLLERLAKVLEQKGERLVALAKLLHLFQAQANTSMEVTL